MLRITIWQSLPIIWGLDSFEAQDDMDAADDDDISLGSEDSEYDSSDQDGDDEDTGEEEREGNGVEAQVEQKNDAGDGPTQLMSKEVEMRSLEMGQRVRLLIMMINDLVIPPRCCAC